MKNFSDRNHKIKGFQPLRPKIMQDSLILGVHLTISFDHNAMTGLAVLSNKAKEDFGLETGPWPL